MIHTCCWSEIPHGVTQYTLVENLYEKNRLFFYEKKETLKIVLKPLK